MQTTGIHGVEPNFHASTEYSGQNWALKAPGDGNKIMTKAKSLRFMGTIYSIWMMRHVDVPDEIADALQKQMAKAIRGDASRKGEATNRNSARARYIPVVTIVNGKSAQTTLIPAGGGRFRLQINSVQRKAADVDVGDVIGIELRLDRSSRELPVPADLRAGLKQHPKAAKVFAELPPGHKRQFIQWFDSAKSGKARKRRFERAIDHLVERAMLQRRPAKHKEE